MPDQGRKPTKSDKPPRRKEPRERVHGTPVAVPVAGIREIGETALATAAESSRAAFARRAAERDEVTKLLRSAPLRRAIAGDELIATRIEAVLATIAEQGKSDEAAAAELAALNEGARRLLSEVDELAR